MNKLINDISSAYWWVGVVVVGILINIASSYIRKIMESKLSIISVYWRGKQNEKAEKIAQQIEILRSNNELKIIYALRESRYRIRSVSYLVFAAQFFVAAIWLSNHFNIVSIICMTFAGVSVLLGLEDHRAAMKVKHLVENATNGLEKLET